MIKIGDQFFYYVYYKTKLYGEVRTSIWARTKKEAKEKFIKEFGKMKINKIEYIEDDL